MLCSVTHYLRRLGFLGGAMGLLLLLVVPIGHAQDYGKVEATETNIQSYFYFSEPGEGTIEVKVMGTVQNPGLYRLGVGTDLGQLMAP
jgi:hypothetical protein